MSFEVPAFPEFLLQDITYKENINGYYDEYGQWIKNTDTETNFKGVILPLNEEDLKLDVNGTYTKHDYKLYTKTSLSLSQNIVHNSITYEIQSKINYLNNTDFRRYIIRRVGDVNE